MVRERGGTVRRFRMTGDNFVRGSDGGGGGGGGAVLVIGGDMVVRL